MLRGRHRAEVVVVILFTTLRLYATLGAPVGYGSDSPSYFELRWWGGLRLPVVPLLYDTVGDHRAIATIQSAVGVVCWSVAALLLGPLLSRPAVRVGFHAALLGLGLTIPVARFDTTLLSESLSLSFGVLLAALLLRLGHRPSTGVARAAVVVAALWGLSRPNSAMVLVALGAGLGVWGWRSRGWLVRPGLALLGLGALGLALAASNSTVQDLNTAQVLDRRIIGHADEAWFVERGMPDDAAAIVATVGRLGSGARTTALMTDPEFARWVEARGGGLYAQFLLTHPGFVLRTTIDDRYPIGAVIQGVTDWSEFGDSRAVLPTVVERAYWPRRPADGVLVVALLGAVALAAWRGRQVGVDLAVALALVAALNVVLVTHTAGESYGRLLITSSVWLRLAVLWWLARALDGASRPSPCPAPSSSS